MGRNSGMDLKAENEAEARKEGWLFASFLITLGAPVQGWPHPQRAGLSHINPPRLTWRPI